jgi:ankyrin repeat protein
VLRHCLAPSLREQLNALPESLDATYERVLDEIHTTKQGRHAHRLLQCLTVAMRPLRVEELSEVLAFELDTTEGELPRYHPDWRWEDQEHAVLAACSSLITIVKSENSRVIQFSHFSVKEYLTSERLSTASVDVSRYHIALEPAHLIIARACLGVLLNLDMCIDKEEDESSDEGGSDEDDEGIPLRNYAAEYWTSHAQVGTVSSCLNDAMETLFDPNKPYFGAWMRSHNAQNYSIYNQSQLYFAAFLGFDDLVQHIIDRHPEQVNDHNFTYFSPLVGALVSRKHSRVAELLVTHGAQVHIRGDPPLCCTISRSHDGRVNAVQFLLEHGAQVNASNGEFMTPLHYAAKVGCPEIAQILLEHGGAIAPQNSSGQVPLHLVSELGYKDEGERLVLARLLLMGTRAGSCMDVNAQDLNGETPLHRASYNRRPKIVQLLLDHGANAHTKDNQGRSPLHQMSPRLEELDPWDVLRVTQLLLEQGIDVNVRDKDHETPLHVASSMGLFENTRLLLDYGAKADAENVHGQIPLHLVSKCHPYNDEHANIVRLLLQQEVDVNARDKHMETPLHFASSRGRCDVALALLDHDADVHAQNVDGRTPLHQVSMVSEYQKHDYHRLAQLMLERGADVNARDKDQETPLHSASYMSKLGVARVLLDHGANIHARNVQGQTPLHIVSHGVHFYGELVESDLVQLFLSRGADVNSRDVDRATPFLLACFCLKPNTAEKLLKNGADVSAVNIRGQNAWHLVSQNLSYRNRITSRALLGELLLGHEVGIHELDEDERTPLHLSCYYGQVDVAEMLLDHGAQANASDIRGRTPLHQVTLGIGNYDYKSSGMEPWMLKEHPGRVIRLAQRLLENGADVNAQNKEHETPLHLASRLRLHEMVRFLLKHGADPNAKNSEGKSPLQLATGRKGKAMRRLLSGYSAKEA